MSILPLLERVGTLGATTRPAPGGGEVPEAWRGWWGAAGSAERGSGETPAPPFQLLLGNADWLGGNPVYLAAPPPPLPS